jgi:hypothetical protein
MHLAYPETSNWRFVHSEVVDVDKDIFRHFEWKDWNQSQSTRLIVAVQPPWVLSPQDLLNFQGCQSVQPIFTHIYIRALIHLLNITVPCLQRR